MGSEGHGFSSPLGEGTHTVVAMTAVENRIKKENMMKSLAQYSEEIPLLAKKQK